MAKSKKAKKKGFGVILADCPWLYAQFADTAHGAAKSHYDTMDLDKLKALKPAIDEWAAKDCILAFWATWPKLDQAFEVLAAWGFEYITGTPWLKVVPDAGTIKTGIGFWWQSVSEVLLIARRGKPKTERLPILALLSGDGKTFHDKEGQPVYCDRIGKHSEKPLGIHEWLEHKLDGPYLELFATQERKGWTTYGRALGTEITPKGAIPYKSDGKTRTVRGEERPRELRHEALGKNLRLRKIGWQDKAIGKPGPKRIGWDDQAIGKVNLDLRKWFETIVSEQPSASFKEMKLITPDKTYVFKDVVQLPTRVIGNENREIVDVELTISKD